MRTYVDGLAVLCWPMGVCHISSLKYLMLMVMSQVEKSLDRQHNGRFQSLCIQRSVAVLGRLGRWAQTFSTHRGILRRIRRRKRKQYRNGLVMFTVGGGGRICYFNRWPLHFLRYNSSSHEAPPPATLKGRPLKQFFDTSLGLQVNQGTIAPKWATFNPV